MEILQAQLLQQAVVGVLLREQAELFQIIKRRNLLKLLLLSNFLMELQAL
ncbi:MAG: hypothetical protein WA584_07475 [Pyrinomonadaceae bacterium]